MLIYRQSGELNKFSDLLKISILSFYLNGVENPIPRHLYNIYLYRMPAILAPVLYCSLALLWLYRRHNPLLPNKSLVSGALLFKIALGCLNYYIWTNVIGHGDSIRYMHDSLIVYNSLFEHPAHFVELLFQTSVKNVPEHLQVYQHALFIEWHVPEYNMVRLLAILNVFSFGNAYGNIVILCLLIFSAQMFLFRKLINTLSLTQNSKLLLFAILFFLPSTIFWSSGLLKEGPVLAFLSVLCACTIQMFQLRNKSEYFRYTICILITLFALFLIRDYVAILCLFNGAILLLIANARKTLRYALLLTTLLASAVLLLTNSFSNGFLNHLKTEQTYFLLSGTDPDYTFQTLDGTFRDLIGKIPYVINNVLFRPNILHSSTLFRIYQSIELLLSWSLILWLLLRNRKHIRLSPAGIAVMLLCIELLFLFGLMVTDADTLSRYRSVPVMGLLLLSFLGARKPSETVIN